MIINHIMGETLESRNSPLLYLPSPVESRGWLLHYPHSTRRRTSQLRFRENTFRLLVYMLKLKEGDTTPDPQPRCNGFVEGMAYKRENWAPVCNEVRFREERSEGGEGKSRCSGLRTINGSNQ